jgi:hypothetical protein
VQCYLLKLRSVQSYGIISLVCDIEKKVACHGWGGKIKYEINGTSSVRAHLNRCCDYKRQILSSSMISAEGPRDNSPSVAKFDQEAIRSAMVKMFINMEIPFREVEHESYHEFMSLVSP